MLRSDLASLGAEKARLEAEKDGGAGVEGGLGGLNVFFFVYIWKKARFERFWVFKIFLKFQHPVKKRKTLENHFNNPKETKTF